MPTWHNVGQPTPCQHGTMPVNQHHATMPVNQHHACQPTPCQHATMPVNQHHANMAQCLSTNTMPQCLSTNTMPTWHNACQPTPCQHGTMPVNQHHANMAQCQSTNTMPTWHNAVYQQCVMPINQHDHAPFSISTSVSQNLACLSPFSKWLCQPNMVEVSPTRLFHLMAANIQEGKIWSSSNPISRFSAKAELHSLW